jgi:1,4-dihydroxy-2-naphthoyl-CoA hydrolase
MLTPEQITRRGDGHLPGLLGLVVTQVASREIRGELAIRPDLRAPNGFLHAGTVFTLADTLAGYGCVAHLPPGASGFTTVETKTNHLGTALEGTIECVATAAHLGRSTQVWDAVVSHGGRTIALYRCTQMVLYPKVDASAAQGQDVPRAASAERGSR